MTTSLRQINWGGERPDEGNDDAQALDYYDHIPHLHNLMREIEGALAVIELDICGLRTKHPGIDTTRTVGGVDPGVGKVVPLPLTHAQLRRMVELLTKRPSHTDAEFYEMSRKYNALLELMKFSSTP